VGKPAMVHYYIEGYRCPLTVGTLALISGNPEEVTCSECRLANHLPGWRELAIERHRRAIARLQTELAEELGRTDG
jgi:hypothetical protein